MEKGTQRKSRVPFESGFVSRTPGHVAASGVYIGLHLLVKVAGNGAFAVRWLCKAPPARWSALSSLPPSGARSGFRKCAAKARAEKVDGEIGRRIGKPELVAPVRRARSWSNCRWTWFHPRRCARPINRAASWVLPLWHEHNRTTTSPFMPFVQLTMFVPDSTFLLS